MERKNKNPSGYWSHQGEYFVAITENAKTSHLPVGAKLLEGRVVSVKNGRILAGPGLIQFYAEGKPFHWDHKHIDEIRDCLGNLLWQNNDRG